MLLALSAGVQVVLCSTNVHKDMIFIAFKQHWAFLVCSDPHAILKTLFTESSAALLIIKILVFDLSTTHTSKSVFLSHELFITS